MYYNFPLFSLKSINVLFSLNSYAFMRTANTLSRKLPFTNVCILLEYDL